MAINKRHALLALVVMLGLGFRAGAQTPAADGGPREGIKVHGHWTIDVLNADGSLATHTEFENALTANSGASLLAELLGSGRSRGQWIVQISGTSHSNSPCGPPAITPPDTLPCRIGEPDLVVSAPSSSGRVEMSGSFAATMQNAVLARVETQLISCNSDVSSAACRGPSDPAFGQTFHSFTSHTLDTAIPVTKGQLVQVKVTITFS